MKKGLAIERCEALFYMAGLVRWSECVSIEGFLDNTDVLQTNQSAINVPEVAFGTREFNSNFVLTPEISADEHHAALTLFFGDGIHEQECLAGFDFYAQRQQASVHTHGFCLRVTPERLVVDRAAIHSNRDC
jgi:hypothetical protein